VWLLEFGASLIFCCTYECFNVVYKYPEIMSHFGCVFTMHLVYLKDISELNLFDTLISSNVHSNESLFKVVSAG